MKKVGLTTIYSVPNYGSVLQTFATQELLRKMGCECRIINYKYPNEWHYKRGTKKMNVISRTALLLGLKRHHRKTLKLNTFKKKYFNFTPLYKNLNALERENWDEYDWIIVGSDQVWNPRFLKGDTAYMLSYLPDHIKRSSLASSFASKALPESYIETYRKYLSRFDHLSVREKNGVDIFHNELGINRKIKVLLDPTLLLSKKEWLELIPRSGFQKKNPYILFYMLDYAFDPKPYIFQVMEYFARKLKYDVMILEGYIPMPFSSELNAFNKTDASVEEFIDLFCNADLVITSSFHGSAFAVNFGIPLISIIPDNKQDDRQSTLLRSVGLGESLVSKGTDIKNINPFYEREEEQKRLDDRRNDSLQWIKQIMCLT